MNKIFSILFHFIQDLIHFIQQFNDFYFYYFVFIRKFILLYLLIHEFNQKKWVKIVNNFC
jgi:hypothetical protein